MKRELSTHKTTAFTILELLIVIAIIALLVAMLLPAASRGPQRSARINCVNNLKQVTLAFKVWAGDNGGKYPMEVSTNEGGTKELAGGANTFVHFLVMSNELNTPKILFCSQETDRARIRATAWNLFPDAGQVPYAGNTNTSYFVGLEATDTGPLMLLTGDRNITNGLPRKNGVMELSTNRLAGWTAEMHKRQGNVGLTDASVQTHSTHGLQEAIKSLAVTNRLAMP